MIIDIIVALVLAYGFYTGYSRGLIKTLFASLSLFVAVIAAIKLSPIFIGIIESLLHLNPAINFVLGFVLTFIIVLALIRFIGNKLTDLLKSIKINFINQILGGAFMSLFFALLLSYGLFFLSNLRVLSEDQKNSSFTYAMLEPLPQVTQGVARSLKPVFSEFWDKMVETMDQINEKAKELDQEETEEDSRLKEG